MKAGDARERAASTVLAEFGQENITEILALYNEFARSIDYRALVDWSVKQPLPELLMPLFVRAVVATVKGLRLGEIQAELEAACAEERELARSLRIEISCVAGALDPQRHAPAKICAYLVASGWELRERNPFGSHWQRVGGLETVFVPERPGGARWAKEAAFAIQCLADAHGTGELGVLVAVAAAVPEKEHERA